MVYIQKGAMPSGQVESVIKTAHKSKGSLRDSFGETEEEKKKGFRVNCMRFRDVEDIMLRFPFAEELEEEQDVFMWRGKPVVSRDIADDIIAEEFKELPKSLGRIRLYSLLTQNYWCITNPMITRFLNGNSEHQVHSRRHKSQMSRSTISSRPGDVVFVDLTFMKRSGSEGLVVVVDAFSKYIAAAPFKSRTAESIATKVEALLEQFPKPVKVLKSDNGKEFAGAFDVMLERLEIKHVRSQPHNPTAAGQVEVANRIIKTFLTSAPDKGYGAGLRNVLKAYNSSVNPRTGYAPRLLNDRDIPAGIMLDVKRKLRGNAENSEPNKRYEPPLAPGDKVRLDNLELNPDWKRQKKAGQFKSSHRETWSRTTYTVKSFLPVRNAVKLVEFPGRQFTRGSVLLIPKDNDEEEVTEE